MADPTLEELQTQIDELKDLITTQYEPPSGSEYSYPVVNQPMNDEMWQYVTLGLGSGILDEGGRPYWLRGRENANNTLRITVSTTKNNAQAAVRGFYHRMTEDKTFTVPGVTSTTTYQFCLTYDPAASATPGGPISLQMYAGEPPTTMGRFHVVLWKLTRKPNQLLTDAAVETVRPKLSPRIAVDTFDSLPDPSGYLWGTQAFVADEDAFYRTYGSSEESGGPTQWRPVTSPAWRDLSYAANRKYAGHGHQFGYVKVGNIVRLRGHIARADGGNFSMPSSDGWYLGTLPVGARPALSWDTITSGAGYFPPRLVRVTVNSNGEIWAYPETSTTWISLDGIVFPVE